MRDELAGIPENKWGPEVRRLLDGPPMPTAVGYLWEWFCELSNARPAGMGGPEAIGFNRLHEWQQLHGIRLRSWEIACIERLDAKWREITHQYQEQRQANAH